MQKYILTSKDQAPHRGNYGICAPNSVAGDQRALIGRPYASLAYILSDAGALAAPLGSTGTFVPQRTQFLIGNQGETDIGTDVGIADTLTPNLTSFYSDNRNAAPFRDFEFVTEALSVVPDGPAFVAANYAAGVNATVSVGGDHAGLATWVAQQGVRQVPNFEAFGVSDAIVSNFFMSHSMQLKFRNESAYWELATPIFHPSGIGLFNGLAPNNGRPLAGKVMALPFAVQLPRATTGGSMGQIAFVNQRLQSVFVDTGAFNQGAVGPTYCTNVAAGAAAGAAATLVQLFKVYFIGYRLCGCDNILSTIMSQLGCDMSTAQRLAAALPK